MKENLCTINNAFKRLSITTDDVDKNEILPFFKPKILNAIDSIRNRKKRADASSIFEEVSKHEASNIDKNTISELIDEMLKNNIIINKKSSFGDSLRRAAEKSEDNENENTDSVAENENLYRTETENESKDLQKPSEDINLCSQTPKINQISDTPLIKDNVNHLNHLKSVKDIAHKDDHQIRTLEAQLAALKSHFKCEITNINSKIEFMSNNLDKKLRESYDQNQNLALMRENNLFLQTELKEKNQFIKTLMETQTAALESLTTANQKHQNHNFKNTPSKLPKCNSTSGYVQRNTNLEKQNCHNQQQIQEKSGCME